MPKATLTAGFSAAPEMCPTASDGEAMDDEEGRKNHEEQRVFDPDRDMEERQWFLIT